MADDPTTTSSTGDGGDPGDGGAPPQGTPPTGDPAGDDLGEAGKKAIAEERKARRAAEKAAKDLESRLAEIERANLSETEQAIAKARDEARSEVLTEANRKLVRAEVKAVAADKLQDPADALALLDLEEFEVDDDGNVDTKAIEAAIASLVESKPYLSKDATSRGPQGTGGGGARPQPLPLNGDPLLNTLKNKLGINQ